MTTCTKVRSGKTRVIDSADVATCTRNGKGIVQDFVESRYQRFWQYEHCWSVYPGGPPLPRCGSDDFSNLDLHGSLFFLLISVNLSGSNLSGSLVEGPVGGVNLTGADLRNVRFAGLGIDGTYGKPFFAGVDLTNADLHGRDVRHRRGR